MHQPRHHSRLQRQANRLPVLACLLLVACGGGGGGSSSAPPVDGTPSTPLSTLTLTLPAHGIGPSQLAVIVAAGDATSEAIATSYQQKRGIPAANIIRVTLPSTTDSITSANFATLKANIDAQLPAGIQATLLTWSAPSRVAGPTCSMSITSAMAFGYQSGYCSTTGGATTGSLYFDSESQAPASELANLRPSMMLGRSTLDAANLLIDRGVAADGSAPAGTGWLVRTSDVNRNVRYPDFVPLPALWADTLTLNYVDNSTGSAANNVISGKTDVLFYFTGLPTVSSLTTNTYRPGAVGDALTSFAGILPAGNGQTPVTAWLDAGLTGSYGTVEEPYNITDKFPEASVLIDQYWRGATLIEAYWKSVKTPGEGLFVGEPLARPWPDTPSFTISGDNYLITSRAFRPSSRYALEYRTSSTGSWINLASFTAASRARVQTFTAPRPPATATQIRWTGPCATNSAQTCQLAASS